METADRERRVLILAPVGRDAELALLTISGAGMLGEICDNADELCRGLEDGAGALLLTQEALCPEVIQCLLAALDAQPPWSDIPLVILVGSGRAANAHLAQLLGEHANATFIERPVGTATLVRALEMALRARRRQYDLREYLLTLAKAQEAERQARAAAEDAVRIRDQFLASVAHDLKNPLTAVKGMAQLLQRQIRKGKPPDADTMMTNLERIEGVAMRAIGQIDELLDVARLQAGQPLPLTLADVDLIALAERVASELQEAHPTHHIRLESSVGEIHGTWDGRRLERALSNLLGNAVKYSPSGGEILVRLDRQGDVVRLAVQDEGIGIPADDLPHLFERFYRARNASELAGTGLGLAGAHQIVTQHGGDIAIESEEGRGTHVTLSLPLNVVETEEPVRAAG